MIWENEVLKSGGLTLLKCIDKKGLLKHEVKAWGKLPSSTGDRRISAIKTYGTLCFLEGIFGWSFEVVCSAKRLSYEMFPVYVEFMS